MAIMLIHMHASTIKRKSKAIAQDYCCPRHLSVRLQSTSLASRAENTELSQLEHIILYLLL